MNKRSAVIILIISNLIAILVGLFLLLNDPLFTGMRTVASAYQLVSNHYMDKIDPEKLFDGSLAEIRKNLDPFTSYIPPKTFQFYQEENQGEFYGIGVEITVRDGLLTVISPIAGTPADAAGLRAGDQVVMIGDTDARTLEPDQAIELIRGKPGTIVELKIKRPGLEKEFSVKLARAAIKLSSIDYAGVVNSIGYIRLTRFALNSYGELIEALDSIKSLGAKGLVLDLRGNPGGFLEVAVAITGLFLPKDKLIVYTKGRSFNEDFAINNFMEGNFQSLPLVVLVDEGSASASEILAGALQDYDRAVLVGDTTFGKGLVQNITPLQLGGAFRLTVSKYFLPSGRIIQKFSDQDRSRNVSYAKAEIDSTYETMGGRKVHGGGGVVPDIIISKASPNILEALLSYGGYYFDFAVEYLRDHRQPINLPLSDSVLTEFTAYLEKRGFTTLDLLSNAFADFMTQARKDSAGFLETGVIPAIRKKLDAYRIELWQESREEIRDNLSRSLIKLSLGKEQEYQSFEFRYDPQLGKAFQLLRDSNYYGEILRGSH